MLDGYIGYRYLVNNNDCIDIAYVSGKCEKTEFFKEIKFSDGLQPPLGVSFW